MCIRKKKISVNCRTVQKMIICSLVIGWNIVLVFFLLSRLYKSYYCLVHITNIRDDDVHMHPYLTLSNTLSTRLLCFILSAHVF